MKIFPMLDCTQTVKTTCVSDQKQESVGQINWKSQCANQLNNDKQHLLMNVDAH